MKSLGKHLISVLIILLFIAGIIIFSFPYMSDYFHTRSQTRVIDDFNSSLNLINEDHIKELIQAARDYNEALRSNPNRFYPTQEESTHYHTMLQIDVPEAGNNIIGTLEIKELDMILPIYLGTDEEMLRIGIGHIEGTSLPVGGAGTHAVITGHRGLHSSKLMTDVDRMKIGDVFTLNILNLRLNYITDQIEVVLPDDFTKLTIYPDKDYVTLLTCTPIGVNSHRLLIRGVRIPDYEISEHKINTEEYQISIIESIKLYVLFLSLLLLLVLIYILVRKALKREKQNNGK